MDIDSPSLSPSSPPSVLLVEPDPALAARYTGWLEDEYEVQTVENETDAVDTVDGEIDVVVFDQRVSNPDPDPDSSVAGDALQRTIRKRDIDCRLALIAAAEPSFDAVQRGYDDSLVAPISGTDLRRVVDRLALRAAYDDQLRTFYELASKRALLDRDRPDAELAASRRYAALEDRLAAARARADETVADLLVSEDNGHRRGVLRDILREGEN